MTSTSSSNKSEHANQTGPYKREFPFVFRRSFWLNSISLISFMFMNPLHSVLSSIARGTCLCFILNGPFLCRILIIPYILTIIPKESTFCPIPPSFPLPPTELKTPIEPINLFRRMPFHNLISSKKKRERLEN